MNAKNVEYQLTLKVKHSHSSSEKEIQHPYRLSTRPSAYAQVFGALDNQKNKLEPPGMKLLAHVIPINCLLFDLHAIKDFSVGVAMENYR